jgi:hypothetical protein
MRVCRSSWAVVEGVDFSEKRVGLLSVGVEGWVGFGLYQKKRASVISADPDLTRPKQE